MENNLKVVNDLIKQNQEWIDETWKKVETKLRRTSVELKDKIPCVSQNGVYDDKSNATGAWTNGFWPGIMWLMYHATGEESFKVAAETVEDKLDNALERFLVLHHDVGFMWHISAGANFRLTGNEKSKNRNLHAAAALAARYNIDGGFIKAWNEKPFGGLAIIDCMMNLPLLYWASEQTNNVAYRKIAMSHADKTMKHHIRGDGSVFHSVDFDLDTGEVKGYPFTQGYDTLTSSWARGQAWAIYGFVLSFIHTGKQEYLDTAKNVAHYFIANVCNTDYVPLHDFRAPEEPVYIDTSSGAIAACGLIEIAKVVPEFEQKMYMQAAINIMKALTEKHCDFSEEEQSILQNSSGFYGKEVHQPCIYGEYYYVEAMYKLKGFDVLFW